MLQVSVQIRKMPAAKVLSARSCLNITNTNQACLFIFVKTNISSIDWEVTLHIVLDTCALTKATSISALRLSHVHCEYTLNISSHSFSPALEYELLPIRDLIAGNLRTVYTGTVWLV